MAKYSIILIPTGAIVPEEIKIPIAPKGDFIERVSSGREQPVIMEVNSRELQALVEYRDLFNVDITAVIGLHGAMYNTIWNTYVSTMRRTTVDALIAEQQIANDALADQGQVAINTPSTRRASLSRVRFDDGAEQQTDSNDDAVTGDIGA